MFAWPLRTSPPCCTRKSFFFPGLIEFLFNLNDDVVQVVRRAVTCFLAILYIVLTASCSIPKMTLPRFFWYITIFLFPFNCSNHARTKTKEPWNDTISFDTHILNVVAKDPRQRPVRFSMCRDDGKVVKFLGALTNTVPAGLFKVLANGSSKDSVNTTSASSENQEPTRHIVRSSRDFRASLSPFLR